MKNLIMYTLLLGFVTGALIQGMEQQPSGNNAYRQNKSPMSIRLSTPPLPTKSASAGKFFALVLPDNSASTGYVYGTPQIQTIGITIQGQKLPEVAHYLGSDLILPSKMMPGAPATRVFGFMAGDKAGSATISIPVTSPSGVAEQPVAYTLMVS